MMSGRTRPGFFCTRPNGAVSPMIALDDLPQNLQIRGVPRTITPVETQGMTSCGVVAPRAEPWIVESTNPITHVVPNKKGLANLQDVLVKIVGDTSVPAHHRMAVQGILYQGLNSVCMAELVTLAPMAPRTSAAACTNSANSVHRQVSRLLL